MYYCGMELGLEAAIRSLFEETPRAKAIKRSEDEKLFDDWLQRTVGSMIKEYKSLGLELLRAALREERLKERFVPATYFPRVREHIENTTLYRATR